MARDGKADFIPEEKLAFQFKKLHSKLLSMVSENSKFRIEYFDNLEKEVVEIIAPDLKKQKKGKYKVQIKEDLFKKDYEVTRSNAYLTYSFSIFEIFAAQLLKHLIKEDPEIEERYFGRWKKFIDEKLNKNKHGHIYLNPEYISDKSWQIENYNTLLRYENSNISNFISSLIGIKETEKGTAPSINTAAFNLFWKVRHLLTHRGEEIDAQLIKEISSIRKIKEESGVLNNFLKFHADIHKLDVPKEGEINPEELYGKNLKIPLHSVINAIIFQAAWLVMHIKSAKKADFFSDLYHDILINTSGKNRRTIAIYRNLLNLGMETYAYKVVNTHNEDLAAVPDPAKFNFQLLNYELYKIELSRLENPSSKTKLKHEVFEKNKKYNFVFSEEVDKNLIELLDAHLKDKRSKFLEILKKTNMKNYEEWEDWFIFDRYRKKKEFKEIVKQKNEK
tara:strand:- start:3481 stop:4824 length:1344 start_codon:yes stop_codon:yes gene_type:complete